MEAGPSNKRRRVAKTRRQQDRIREEEEQEENQAQEQDQGRSEDEEEQQEEDDNHSEGEEPLPNVVVNQEMERADREQPAATKDLKLKMPEFKGKKGRDPQVHIQAFESWATLQQLPKANWKACFPQTLKSTAQKWYFNFPPENLTSYKVTAKALIQRFKEEKTDEELLSQLGRIKQRKLNVTQFVEEIKDLTRQLSSPPGEKTMRAWFLNGTALKDLNRAEITNPTRRFEELVQRAKKMERKKTRKVRTSSSETSTSEDSSESDEEPKKKKRRDWQAEFNLIKTKVAELSGKRTRTSMPSKGEKWCVPCRVDTHSTSECTRCDYCERRGHLWEDCPIRLAAPVFAVEQARPREAGAADGSYRSSLRLPRKFVCWNCQKEGHMARDCPEEPKPRAPPFRPVQNAGNPQVNLVQPQVAAITRAQARSQPEEPVKESKRHKEWQELKEGSAQITKGLRRQTPAQEEATLGRIGFGEMKWVKKATRDGEPQEPASTEDVMELARNKEPDRPPVVKVEGKVQTGAEESKEPEGRWEAINERLQRLSLDVPSLAKGIPVMDKILEEQGWKEAYELNKSGIRDDQAPIIAVECKIRKHWKPVERVTLDGGAGVNVMSERVRRLLDLQVKAAPFKLRMADQTVSEPLGMVTQVPIRVGGVKFEASFLILDVGEAYDMLLGRPWLRAAGAVHDWGTDELTMQMGPKTVSISTRPVTVPVKCRPGQMYLAEPDQMWSKLKSSGIMPVATLDLNW